MPRPPRLAPLLALVLAPALALALALSLAAPAPAALPIDDYASYQPATKCSPKAKPGTEQLGRWLVRRFGGGFGPISRACGGSVSEHTEGRAFDWALDATTRRGRRAASSFLDRLTQTDRQGNTDALARRMGVMYVIWDDRMFAAWDGFRAEPYLSSSCKRVKRCSATLRHRDHVHISLTRQGGRGKTSWYLDRRAGG